MMNMDRCVREQNVNVPLPLVRALKAGNGRGGGMERNETNMSCERYNEKHLMIRPRSETPQLEASRCRRFFCSTPPPINERLVRWSRPQQLLSYVMQVQCPHSLGIEIFLCLGSSSTIIRGRQTSLFLFALCLCTG